MSVQELTKTWIEQLPSGHSVIGKELLERSSWPDFLVEWVEQGVASWIRESLTPPDIPLAQMDAEEVVETWHTFETTVVRHWGLPADEMQALLEELAEDLLALLGRPAERIPDLLFGSETSIDRNLLAARLDRVVVHQDLARALLRYAERKELASVDRELAGRVIAQVDQKLKERYDADAWAAQLRPLVELWGGPVPSGMMRDVLRARGADVADRIPEGSEPRTIEWITDQLREGPVSEPTAPQSLSDHYKPFPTDEPKASSSTEAKQEPAQEKEDVPAKRPLSEIFGSTAHASIGEDPRVESSDGGEGALHHRFQFDEPDLDRYLEEKESSNEPEEESDPFGLEKTESTPLSLYTKPEEDSGEREEAGDENTIWKKFLADGDVPDSEDTPDLQETDAPSSVEWLDPAEPEFGGESKRGVRELEKWLGKEYDRFRQEIFDGSEEGLRDALQHLSRLGSWADAARYLQDDVFDRYRIDLFDDVAVDFTDRMQAWFEDLDQPRS